MKRMVVTLLMTLWASVSAAQEWTVTLEVVGQDSYSDSGAVNSITTALGAQAYMSAEAYAEGIDDGQTCETSREFEIDYFFGRDVGYGGHLLFTLRVGPNGAQAVEPAIFYDQKLASGELILAYAGFDEDTAIRVDRFECLPNGQMDLAVTYKGTLFLEMGEGPSSVRVAGSADAELLMLDMNNY